MDGSRSGFFYPFMSARVTSESRLSIELVGINDTPALLDDNKLIRSHRPEGVRFAIRPADREVRLGLLTQTEMNSEIALRDIITAASHLIDLFVRARRHHNAGADGITPGTS